MSRSSRWALALVTLGLAGGAAYWFVYLPLQHEEPVPEIVDASAGDAAVDARAPVAKGKPGKKPAARGGKTRVTGKAGGSKPPAAPVAHGSKPPPPPAGHPPHEKHDRHEKLPAGPSYESALDGNDEQVTIGAKGQADLTDAQLAGPMSDGAFIGECDTPDTTSVTVKVAIRGGHAVGVSVETSPPSMHVNGCIDRHVRSLTWPASPKLDSLVTTY